MTPGLTQPFTLFQAGCQEGPQASEAKRREGGGMGVRERWRRQSGPHAQYRSQGCPEAAHVYRALSKVGWKERAAAGKEKRGASPSRSSGVWQSQVPRHLKDRTQALVYTRPPATDAERLVAVSGPPSAPLFQTTCQIVAEHPPWLKNPKVPCCCY